jgi:hypothetical protein
MTLNRITELENFLNRQMDEQENLSEYLSKAGVLLRVALADDFLEQTDVVICNYLWVICDFITSAMELNEKLVTQSMSLLHQQEK